MLPLARRGAMDVVGAARVYCFSGWPAVVGIGGTSEAGDGPGSVVEGRSPEGRNRDRSVSILAVPSCAAGSKSGCGSSVIVTLALDSAGFNNEGIPKFLDCPDELRSSPAGLTLAWVEFGFSYCGRKNMAFAVGLLEKESIIGICIFLASGVLVRSQIWSVEEVGKSCRRERF